MRTADEMQVITDGLTFPEGPVWRPDGSIVLVELLGGRLTRVLPDGTKETIAVLGGGPNGAAIGPDGACYVCNNGGLKWSIRDGRPFVQGLPDDYTGGRIQRVDLGSGSFETLYDHVGDQPLRGPNDIVFDAHGGFYFTDMGKANGRSFYRGSVCYALPDGSMIKELIHPISQPNGIGLSPDGRRLYVAETETARLWSWDIVAPGELARGPWYVSPHGGTLVFGAPGYVRFDSLAVEQNGNICVATLEAGALTVISPEGDLVDQLKIPGDMRVARDLELIDQIALRGFGRSAQDPW